ncbi:hypothetical protein PWT90_10876 [Aphanocladium album]|nr:hypothetical protein PWT90_10876 [Aphanocladium album]
MSILPQPTAIIHIVPGAWTISDAKDGLLSLVSIILDDICDVALSTAVQEWSNVQMKKLYLESVVIGAERPPVGVLSAATTGAWQAGARKRPSRC